MSAVLLVMVVAMGELRALEEEGEEETTDQPLPDPMLTSTRLQILVNEKNDIRLPCFVDSLRGFVLIWKRGENILTVAGQLVHQDRRIRLESEQNGNWLVISGSERKDEGEYTCQISTFKTLQLTHSIRIRTKPVVQVIPRSGLLVGQVGSSATISCRIRRGSPRPELTWHRKLGLPLPGGQKLVVGKGMTFPSLTRHHSGVYVCRGDNGYNSEGSMDELTLTVQHPPQIEQREMFVHGDQGDTLILTCVVHAQPKANVTWHREGEQLSDEDYEISNIGNHHNLIVESDNSSLADYTCMAINSLGNDTKTITISPRVGPVNFTSDPEGSEAGEYSISWQVQSGSPITHFTLEYKQHGDGHHWEKIDVEPEQLGDDGWIGERVLKDLSKATFYESRVVGTNSYGVGKTSHQFQFATQGATFGGLSNKSPAKEPQLFILVIFVFMSFTFRFPFLR